MLTVSIAGGLGNQLFQIAAASSIAKKNNRKLCLPSIPSTHHSKQNYYETIFQQWSPEDVGEHTTVCESSYHYKEWRINIPIPVQLSGYFQNYKYIEDDFIERLVLPHTPSLDGAFLHIRGGDYVNHWLHDMKLQRYYERAVAMFPNTTKFYIFTNDVTYAKTFSFLNTIQHEFVTGQDEVTCLSFMKNCKLGGICANSTFSWWGAYLNRNGRTLVLPSKWFNTPDIYIDGYFFPGSTICPV